MNEKKYTIAQIKKFAETYYKKEHCDDKSCTHCNVDRVTHVNDFIAWLEYYKSGKGGESTEVCICAAIKCTDGSIIRGHRHNDCFMAARSRNKELLKTKDGQEFITSTGRYVDRREGARLMRKSGLKSKYMPDGTFGKVLFSEDLY